MKMTLDQSHRIVLANLETFQRAQRCADEITEYVWDVLREVTDEFCSGGDPSLKFVLHKDGWLQFNPIPNWQGTSFDLISIGVEGFSLNDLLGLEDGQGCRAYVYSALLADAERTAQYTHVSKHLHELQPPNGFLRAPSNIPGYVFVKALPHISIESLCSRAQLKNHFSSPLSELIDWFSANRKTIAELPKTLSSSAVVRKP